MRMSHRRRGISALVLWACCSQSVSASLLGQTPAQGLPVAMSGEARLHAEKTFALDASPLQSTRMPKNHRVRTGCHPVRMRCNDAVWRMDDYISFSSL